MIILADASLPELQPCFGDNFTLHTYHDIHAEYTYSDKSIEGILCRSTLKIDHALVSRFPNLKVVMTASSGTDHIDTPTLNKNNITLLDAKGANAWAVGNYVIRILKSSAHKPSTSPKNILIIGMGFVGNALLQQLQNQNYNGHIFCYDPYIEIYANEPLTDLIHKADIISLHANAHHQTPYATHHMVNESFLLHMKANSVLINAARGSLVDESALLKYGRHIRYITDVYENEPHINSEIIKYAEVTTPHIAGHSIEAKIRAIRVLSEKLHPFLGLTPPKWPPFVPPQQQIDYDPTIDTKILKNTTPDKLVDTFLNLRKNHLRHEEFP